jgi:hypothetical protein
MKSIWFFVGFLLAIIGVIITASALYSLFHPPENPKLFSGLHPDLWWGIFMLAFGLFFTIFHRKNIRD